MDTQLAFQPIIKRVLQQYATDRAALPDNYHSQVSFDDERGNYLIVDWGWNGDRYLHATPVHISLVDGKVWIQYDDTEEGIATDLVAAGIPQSAIVLGFRHPQVRPHTGFAVA
jgi:hypothetical protein